MLPVSTAQSASDGDAHGRAGRYCLVGWLVFIAVALLIILGARNDSGRPGLQPVCRAQNPTAQFHDLFVVTAAHAGNFDLLASLVASAQSELPSHRVAVYDAGMTLSQRKLVERWWNVAVFPLALDTYPRHVQQLSSGAYRLLALQDATTRLGSSLYVDPGYIVMGSVSAVMSQLRKASLVCGAAVLPEPVVPAGSSTEDANDAHSDTGHQHGEAERAAPMHDTCQGPAAPHFPVTATRTLGELPTVPMASWAAVAAPARSPAVRAAVACLLDRACAPAECTAAALLSVVGSEACPAQAGALFALQQAVRPADGDAASPLRRCGDAVWPVPERVGDASDGDGHGGDGGDGGDDGADGDDGTDSRGGDPVPADADRGTETGADRRGREQGGRGRLSGESDDGEAAGAGDTSAADAARAALMAQEVTDVRVVNAAMAAALDGYTGYTFVTAGNDPFFARIRNLIGSVHFWAPDMPILIYDLGLSQQQVEEARGWANVLEVRRFPFELYPAHFTNLHTYAFKPTIMLETVEERFKIIYLDAGMEMRQPPQPVIDLIERNGYFYTVQEGLTTNMLCCGHVGELTVEQTLQKLGVPRSEVHDKHMCAGGIQGYYLGSPAYHRVLRKAAACALDADCIAPPGSSLANHRFDQSVFSTLINHEGLQCQTDPVFWGNERNLREPPTADETQRNSVVLFTRRGRNGEPYVRHLKRKPK